MKKTLAIITIALAGCGGSSAADSVDVDAVTEAVAAMPDCATALTEPIADGFEGCTDGDIINVPLIYECDSSPVFSVTVDDVIHYGRAGDVFEALDIGLAEVCDI